MQGLGAGRSLELLRLGRSHRLRRPRLFVVRSLLLGGFLALGLGHGRAVFLVDLVAQGQGLEEVGVVLVLQLLLAHVVEAGQVVLVLVAPRPLRLAAHPHGPVIVLVVLVLLVAAPVLVLVLGLLLGLAGGRGPVVEEVLDALLLLPLLPDPLPLLLAQGGAVQLLRRLVLQRGQEGRLLVAQAVELALGVVEVADDLVQVPLDQRQVLARRHELRELEVRHRHRQHGVAVPDQRADALARQHVEDAHRAVGGAGDQEDLAALPDRQAVDLVQVPHQRAQQDARVQVPELDLSLHARRGQERPLLALGHDHRGDGPLVPELADPLARVQVPCAHHAVRPSAGNAEVIDVVVHVLQVGGGVRDAHAVHTRGMPGEADDLDILLEVPDEYFAILGANHS